MCEDKDQKQHWQNEGQFRSMVAFALLTLVMFVLEARGSEPTSQQGVGTMRAYSCNGIHIHVR